MHLSSKHYYGKQCKTCQQSIRYKSSDKCVTCAQGYRQRTKQHKASYLQQYYQANRQTLAAYQQGYYQANRDRIISRVSQYRCDNWEKVKEHLRLSQYRRRAKTHTVPYAPGELKERFAQFDNQCVYCLSRDRITADHFIPIALGGFDCLRNLVPACKSCNSSKQGHDPLKWMRRKGLSEAYITALLGLMLEL